MHFKGIIWGELGEKFEICVRKIRTIEAQLDSSGSYLKNVYFSIFRKLMLYSLTYPPFFGEIVNKCANFDSKFGQKS